MPDTAPLADGLGDIGSRELIAYQTSGGELQTATNEAQTILDQLISDVQLPLMEAQSLVGSAIDEMIGATDQQLLNANGEWAKFYNSFLKTTAKTLDGARNQAELSGAIIPSYTTDLHALVEGDPLELAGQAFPVLGTILGIVSPPPPPVWKIPEEPSTDEPWPIVITGVTPPPPPPPPPPIVITGGVTPPTPVCPPPYGHWPGPTIVTNTPGQSPPINVTVNVPPIVIPPQQPCPAPQVTVTCPPPGTQYKGTPPKGMIATGEVRYNTTTNNWYYSTPPAPADQPDITINNLIQPLAAPAPAPAPPPQGHAPLIAPIPVAGQGNAMPGQINWGSLSSCSAAHEIVSKLGEAGLPGPAQPNAGLMERLVDSEIGKGAWAEAQKAFKLDGGIWENQVREWMGTPQEFGRQFDSMMDSLYTHIAYGQKPDIGVPQKGAAAVFGTKLALASKAEQASSFPMTYLYTADLYSFQYANPQYLPTQIRIDSAYLANTINDGEWTCWTRAIGNLPEPARRVMTADQTRPGVLDIINLYRRGHMTEKDMYARLREQGILDTNYVREYLAVTKVLPTQSDLIRFMVRDASDDSVAKQYGYDEGFNDKFTGQMKEWAKSLGLDEKYFQYSWRSHWDIPSYTQLTEMIARLRPDRLELKEWQQNWGATDNPAVIAARPPKPPVVTRADVVRALQVNDMSPGWIDPLLAVSYTPINRTDAVRAYMMGAFSDEQLYDSFLNTRYSPRDASLMLDFYKKDKSRRLRNISGSWSARKVMTYYKRGLLSQTEAAGLLRDVLPSPELVAKTLNDAELEMEADQRAQMIKSARRAFIFGEFDANQVRSQLSKFRVEDAAIKRLITSWTIERDGRLKQPTVAQIGKWMLKAIISVEDGQRRLRNLGYSMADSDRIIAQALKWDYEGEPPEGDQLGLDVQAEITSQKMAKKSSGENLEKRFDSLIREARRIHQEQTRRALNAGTAEPEAVTIP